MREPVAARPALAAVPALPALPRELLERLPVSALVEMRRSLAHQLTDVEATLTARLAATPAASASAATEPLLDVTEAAKRLRMSRTWLYRHADALPFAMRLDGALRFDPRGLAVFLANRRRGGGVSG